MLLRTPLEFRAAASPALLDRGCVNIISLTEIKSKAGERWPRIRDGVWARAENLLRQKLGATDFFAQFDDVSYLVTMPSADPEDVNVVCLRVAYELYTEFLGNCMIRELIVSNAANVGGDMLMLKPLQPQRIVELADKAGIKDTPPEGFARMVTSVAPQTSGQSARPAAPATPTSTLEVKHHYVPVWSVNYSAITTYACVPKSFKKSRIPQQFMSLEHLSDRERIELELSCLYEGISKVAKLGATGERFLLGLMFSFDVIGSSIGRMEFLATCRDLPAEYRQCLDFTLIGVPPGVAHTRLQTLVNIMRPFARSVSATIAVGARDCIAYQGVGLRAIGHNIDDLQIGRELQAEDVLNLSRLAKTMRFGTFLHGVRNLGLLKAAQSAGIQELSGPTIMPPTEEPRAMTRLTWQKVFATQALYTQV